MVPKRSQNGPKKVARDVFVQNGGALVNLKIHGFEGRRGGKRGCHYDGLGLFPEKVAILFESGAKGKKMGAKVEHLGRHGGSWGRHGDHFGPQGRPEAKK